MAHIAGADNFQADFANQVFNDRTEWALPQYIFDKLVCRFSCPTIDLFATQLNRKLKRYVSWFPDPTSTEVGAFSIEWTHEFPYLFPPFNLIYRYLKTIQQQKVEKALIVFPFWPNQPWYPQLLTMLISHPVMLPKDLPLYLSWQPPNNRTLHPQHNKMILSTTLISGLHCIQWEFHQQLCPVSREPSDLTHLPITCTCIKNGLNFVSRKREIHIVQL